MQANKNEQANQYEEHRCEPCGDGGVWMSLAAIRYQLGALGALGCGVQGKLFPATLRVRKPTARYKQESSMCDCAVCVQRWYIFLQTVKLACRLRTKATSSSRATSDDPTDSPVCT